LLSSFALLFYFALSIMLSTMILIYYFPSQQNGSVKNV